MYGWIQWGLCGAELKTFLRAAEETVYLGDKGRSKRWGERFRKGDETGTTINSTYSVVLHRTPHQSTALILLWDPAAEWRKSEP